MNQRQFTQFRCLCHTGHTHTIRWPTFGQAQCLSGMSIDLILFGGQIGFYSISFADLWLVFELCVLFLRFRTNFFFLFLMTEWGAHKLPFEPHLRQREKILSKTMANESDEGWRSAVCRHNKANLQRARI